MSTTETEAAVLDAVLPRLRAEGYDVFRNPPRNLLPEFMSGYRPDAIAIGNGKKIAIEIVSKEAINPGRRKELQDRFPPDSGWELQIIHARPDPSSRSIEKVSDTSIERSLETVSEMTAAGLIQPALLSAWASFEAIGRRLLPATFDRPQTPGRLVEVLAHEGHLTPGEAEEVRQLIAVRNRLAHGDLDVRIAKADIERFMTVLGTLLSLAKEDAKAS